jgi:fluoroquinolone resistance protein
LKDHSERDYFEGLHLNNRKIAEDPLQKGDYDNCYFNACDFTGADLSFINFMECEFRECNISLTRLAQTSFREVSFISCKLLGLHFEDINNMMTSLVFKLCNLDVCSFNKLKLKKAIFIDSKLSEADFTDTDLGGSVFSNCDLDRAIFRNTNLEGADLRTAFNFRINPDQNHIKKARFTLNGLPGLLGRYDIEIE